MTDVTSKIPVLAQFLAEKLANAFRTYDYESHKLIYIGDALRSAPKGTTQIERPVSVNIDHLEKLLKEYTDPDSIPKHMDLLAQVLLSLVLVQAVTDTVHYDMYDLECPNPWQAKCKLIAYKAPEVTKEEKKVNDN